MKAAIFAGGSGARLWPYSRKNTPKQFMGLIDDKTMLQLCFDRIRKAFDINDIYITTLESYKEGIMKQIPEISETHIIGEPIRRDLGPAIGLAAALIGKNFPDEPLAYIWGADQIYQHEDRYRHLFKVAEAYLEKDPNKLIFLGETPRFANQNIGWIAFGDKQDEIDGIGFHAFKGFRSKPDLETAQDFCDDGKHTWNIGDFITTPTYILSLYKKHVPEEYEKLMKIQEAYMTHRFNSVLNEVYPQLPEFHQDPAIFEKMDPSSALVIFGNVGYADIGAWDTYKEALAKKQIDNVTVGDTLLKDSTDTLIFNQRKETLVVGIDLKDIAIINTDDILLVINKSSIGKIKPVLKELEAQGRGDLT